MRLFFRRSSSTWSRLISIVVAESVATIDALILEDQLILERRNTALQVYYVAFGFESYDLAFNRIAPNINKQRQVAAISAANHPKLSNLDIRQNPLVSADPVSLEDVDESIRNG